MVHNGFPSHQVLQQVTVFLILSQHLELILLPLLQGLLGLPKSLDLGLCGLFDIGLLLSLVVYGVQFLLLCHSVSLHLLIVLVQ
jgi:hypothetical protein